MSRCAPKAARRGKYIGAWRRMRNIVCISRTLAQALGQITLALQTVEIHRTLYIREKGRDEDKIGRDKRNGGKVNETEMNWER